MNSPVLPSFSGVLLRGMGTTHQISQPIVTAESYLRYGNSSTLIEELLLTVTGKIQKFRMREFAIKELRLEVDGQIETR